MIPEDRRAAALQRLSAAAAKSKRGTVAFPPEFVGAANGGAAPPLARLIQGGRGGEVRLKLYLCITMIAVGKPFDLRKAPTTLGWVRTLGLPPDAGPRRVSTALKWLADNSYIARQPSLAGQPPSITLLDAAGGGGPYRPPRDGVRYLGMPIALWTQGWLLDLSATGLAVLFALSDLLGGHDRPRYMTRERRASYGLSHDTWTKATKELVRHGLLEVTRTPQGDDFIYERLRNSYSLNLSRLASQPDQR